MNKGILLILGIHWMCQLTAQNDDHLGDYFLLKGQLLHIDPFSKEESQAGDTKVLVFQDDEIFVAFDSKTTGKYEFYLPLGHVYTIAYGGGKFVNKRVIVDATESPREKKPRSMNLDIGLFEPVDGASFHTLDQAFVKIAYDKEYDDFVPDFDYTDDMMQLLNKELKVARKARTKTSRPAPIDDKDR